MNQNKKEIFIKNNNMSMINAKFKQYFQWKNYISNYLDFQQNNINNMDKAWQHFINFGYNDERFYAFETQEIRNDYFSYKNEYKYLKGL